MAKFMRCIDNSDHEDCMTVNNLYAVNINEINGGRKMYQFYDDNGDFLQTMLPRFESINEEL